MKFVQFIIPAAILATGATATLSSQFAFYPEKDAKGPALGVGEEGTQEFNVFGPSYFGVKKCVSGEIEIKSVYAFFAPEDGPDMNFCLKGYNDTDCEGTDLVVDHQWDIAFLSDIEKGLGDQYNLETPVKSAKVVKGMCDQE